MLLAALSAGGETAMTMSSLLNDVGTIFTSIMGWAGEVGSAVAANPLLLLGVVLPVACVGVGLFKRLIRL